MEICECKHARSGHYNSVGTCMGQPGCECLKFTPQRPAYKPEKLYRKIAGLLQAVDNCRKSGNTEWLDKHMARALELVKAHMPSGGGFDSGTSLDLKASNPEKLVFNTAFHHMDDSGMYCGWTSHRVTVRPSLVHGIIIAISGRNYRDIKDYAYESFDNALTTEVD